MLSISVTALYFSMKCFLSFTVFVKYELFPTRKLKIKNNFSQNSGIYIVLKSTAKEKNSIIQQFKTMFQNKSNNLIEKFWKSTCSLCKWGLIQEENILEYCSTHSWWSHTVSSTVWCQQFHSGGLQTLPYSIIPDFGHRAKFCSALKNQPTYIIKGVARGKGGNSPPPTRNRKNCYRKMVLFPKALFLVTNFRKK